MIDIILKDIQHKAIRFAAQPKGNYAVYFKDTTTSGPDGHVAIADQVLRIELYTKHYDDYEIKQVEDNLKKIGQEYQKYETAWLNSEQIYMTTYTMTYTFKLKEERK